MGQKVKKKERIRTYEIVTGEKEKTMRIDLAWSFVSGADKGSRTLLFSLGS